MAACDIVGLGRGPEHRQGRVVSADFGFSFSFDSDLGSDLALSTPMPSSPSSSAASVDAPPPPPELSHPPYSPSHADLSPPLQEVYSLYNPDDPPASETHLPPYAPPPAPVVSELPDDLEFGLHPPPPLVRASELLGWEDRPSSSRPRTALAVPPRATLRINPTANRHESSAEFP